MFQEVESLSATTRKIASHIDGLLLQVTNGIPSHDSDGTPPDLSSLECLNPVKHAAYIQNLPNLVEQLQNAVADTKTVIRESHSVIPLLRRPGISTQFQTDFVRGFEDLDSACRRVERCCSESSSKVSKLQAFRTIWQELLSTARSIEILREEINRTMGTLPRPAFREGAPATPPPENSVLPDTAKDTQLRATVEKRLSGLRSSFHSNVSTPLKSFPGSSSDELLYRHLQTNHALVQERLDDLHSLAELSERIRNQTYIVGIIQDEAEAFETRTATLGLALDQEAEKILEVSSHIPGIDECDVCLADFSRQAQPLVGEIGVFVQALASRVPFVASDPKRSRSLSQLHSISNVDEVGTGSLPPISSEIPSVDVQTLDRSVRDEMNGLSVILMGRASTLEQKLQFLKLSLTVRQLQYHFETLRMSYTEAELALVKCQSEVFLLQPNASGGPPELAQLKEHLDLLEQSWDKTLSESFDVVKRTSSSLNFKELSLGNVIRSKADKLLSDSEAILRAFATLVDLIRTQISSTEEESDRLEAERLRLLAEAEEAKRREEALQAERARQAATLAAEAAAAEEKRLEEEKLELKSLVEEARELERLQQEKLETERLEQERCEQERLEEERGEEERREEANLEERKHEQERQRELGEAEASAAMMPATISQVLSANASTSISLEGITFQFRATKTPVLTLLTDVFQPGSDVASSSSLSVFSLREDLLKTIQGLRMELLDLDINKAARRSAATLRDSFPPPSFSAQATEKLEAIAERAEAIDCTDSPDSKVEAAFTSLKYEIDSSRVLLERLDDLKEFANLVAQCDAALSDQIDLIDRFPRTSVGSHSGDDIESTDESLTPEHLSRGSTMASDLIHMVDKAAARYLDDVRVRNEQQRLHQTWSEVEEMVKELLTLERSRPSSTISFGRASDISANSDRSVSRLSSKPRLPGIRRTTQGFLIPPLPKTQRSVSGSSGTPTRIREKSSARSVSGPAFNVQSRLYNSTAASRARTTSLSNDTPTKPVPPAPKRTMTPVRPRVTSTSTRGRLSPTFSERSIISYVPGTPSKSPPPKGNFSRAPRMSFGQKLVPFKPNLVKKTYISNPRSKLDIAVGNVVNKLPVDITVSPVEEGWKDRSGKYWIGDEDAKLCFCRILRSQTVMVRVGGGWVELSKSVIILSRVQCY